MNTYFYPNNPIWHKIYKIEDMGVIFTSSTITPIDTNNNYSIFTNNPYVPTTKWNRNTGWEVSRTKEKYDLSIRLITFNNPRILYSKLNAKNSDIRKHQNNIKTDEYFNIKYIEYYQNGPSINHRMKIYIDDDNYHTIHLNSKNDNYWFHIIPTDFIEYSLILWENQICYRFS